jgi:hypothetical protein
VSNNTFLEHATGHPDGSTERQTWVTIRVWEEKWTAIKPLTGPIPRPTSPKPTRQ